MEEYKLIGYQLVREDAIREKGGDDIIDWAATIVAESKTVNGLLRFARLKKLQDNYVDCCFYIESKEKEYIPDYGGYIPASGNLYHKTLEELL